MDMIDFSSITPVTMVLYFFTFIAWVVIGSKIGQTLLVRIGFIKVRFLMQNRRTKTAWKRPNTENIKHKGRSYNFDVKRMTFDGSTPEAYYNMETGEQIDFYNFERGSLSATSLDKLISEAFNLGKDYMRRKQDKMQQMLMFILFGIMGLGALMVYILMQIQPK